MIAGANDLRLAARRLWRAPGFTLAAVLTLALGTGATGAVFSLVNAVLLRPLPFAAPEQVGLVWAVQPSGERTWLSFPELDELQRDSHAQSLTAVAGMTDIRLPFASASGGEEVQALAVSHGMLTLLGVRPALGRDFTRDDDRQDAAPVVVLSDAFWRTRLGADRAIVGRAITLNDRAYQVIGVLPAAFGLLPASSVLPDRVDVWLPLEPHLASRQRNVRYLHALARLRPGATFEQADARLHAHASRVTRAFAPTYTGGRWSFTVVSFADDVLERARMALTLLFGLVALVLLMACLNVAHLLLARGEARRADLAIRTALGASPVRLAGEVLAEAALLAACGSLLGVMVAAATPAFVGWIDAGVGPGALPRVADVSLDRRVALFMIGLTLVTVLLSGAAPLAERLWIRRPTLALASRGGGRTRRSARVSQALVIAQTAFATTIIVSTLFLTETLRGLLDVDLGFRPAQVLTARVSLSPKYPAGPASADFFERATAAIAQLPGVTGAAAITQLPLSGAMLGSTFLLAPTPDARRVDADLRVITPPYFGVIGTPLLAGRTFTQADAAASPAVAIVDESFARRLDPSGHVIGRRIRWFRQPDAEIEIVGVVRAVRHRGPDEAARETVYRPLRQSPRASMFVVAQTAQEAEAAVTVTGASLRAALHRLDPSQPVADIATLDQRLDRAVGRARASLTIASVLGGLALLLGSIGLYGVLSVGVAQRLREFGVRLTIGATPASVRRRVLAEGLTLASGGILLGLGGAAALAILLQDAFGATSAAQALPWVAGVGTVLACSAAALWIPARRAGAVDPIITLRSE